MVKWAAAGTVLLLLAAAFFLPEWLSAANDKQLLDRPAIQLQNTDQEGFAESLQLSVAEKVLLIRSGTLRVTELDKEGASWMFVSISGSKEPDISAVPPPELLEDDEMAAYIQEATHRWEQRLAAVKQELRSLQAAGGLPFLWSADGELSCASSGELLYMDPDTRLNFQVYRMSIKCESYSMNVTVDVQSGRILAFSLQWEWSGGSLPVWPPQGAANFGGVWRNYWGLDSISSGWYNEYNRDMLERVAKDPETGGDYDARGLIAFTYDSQPVAIPLAFWSIAGRSCGLSWNV